MIPETRHIPGEWSGRTADAQFGPIKPFGLECGIRLGEIVGETERTVKLVQRRSAESFVTRSTQVQAGRDILSDAAAGSWDHAAARGEFAVQCHGARRK